jgi:hypothetical protein
VRKTRQQPSLLSITLKDTRATVGVLVTIGSWFFFLAGGEQNEGWLFFCVAVVATSIGVMLFLSRVSFYRYMFDQGIKLPARVISSVYNFDQGRRNNRSYWIEYEYVYQGQNYRRGVAVQSRWDSPPFVEDDIVTLIVNPDNPEEVVIQDLFI